MPKTLLVTLEDTSVFLGSCEQDSVSLTVRGELQKGGRLPDKVKEKSGSLGFLEERNMVGDF